ncbi:hypothetical protein CEXT_211711 [Caerostris extrusa]|uniref:Uncharacterized protein n=1 Tax=Caerostris extrusa TaxID=172846 RepID=A0AAV4PI88_CAEEX|nr:hypothetical protein CEXT_211711 [Caerostris extrusa]
MNDSCEDGTSILNLITHLNHPNVTPNKIRESERSVPKPAVDNPTINYRLPSYDPFDNQNVLRNAHHLAWEDWPPIPLLNRRVISMAFIRLVHKVHQNEKFQLNHLFKIGLKPTDHSLVKRTWEAIIRI